MPYVLLRRRDPPPVELLAAPVLEGDRYQDRPIYFSDVVVHRDSDVTGGFESLRGRSWAYNDPMSHSGYNITRYELIRRGLTGGFFGRVDEAGSHQRALRMIAAGEVDAAAIDSQVLSVALRDHPDLAEELRIIDSLGPSSIQPVVARTGLDATVKSRMTEALVGLDRDQAARRELSRGMFRRFTRVADEQYDDIRRMIRAAEETDFMTIR